MTDSRSDTLNWTVHTTVEKWHRSEDHDAGLEPDAVEHFDGNLLLNAGITRLLNLLGGLGGTAFNTANSRIGVGDSSTAAAATDTALIAATNKFYQLVSTAPVVSAQTITYTSTFATGDGNFAWAEWGIDNGTASNTTAVPPMLNRKVQAMGTKASGATWTLTVAITVS